MSGTIDPGTVEKKPLNVKLENPIHIDGAGSDLVFARLPLQPNFTTVIEMVDPSSAQVKKYELKHIGSEKITVPAGTFETTKLAINQIDGGEKFIYWLSPADKNMIKIEAIVPQMGNAKMTAELK